jgi:catechol 2,3-dioxygenase-like lactoylglutathione lyase family enzyme
MRKLIQGLALFTVGLIAGHYVSQPATAQDDRLTGLHLNHVGITAKDWTEALNFYVNTLGFKEAFTFKDKDGTVTTSYLQMSKENFLEVTRAAPGASGGLNHAGIWVDDLNATIARLRQRGVTVADPRIGNSKAPLTSITDPNGIRIELLEYPPESLQQKAMATYR